MISTPWVGPSLPAFLAPTLVAADLPRAGADEVKDRKKPAAEAKGTDRKARNKRKKPAPAKVEKEPVTPSDP